MKSNKLYLFLLFFCLILQSCDKHPPIDQQCPQDAPCGRAKSYEHVWQRMMVIENNSNTDFELEKDYVEGIYDLDPEDEKSKVRFASTRQKFSNTESLSQTNNDDPEIIMNPSILIPKNTRIKIDLMQSSPSIDFHYKIYGRSISKGIIKNYPERSRVASHIPAVYGYVNRASVLTLQSKSTDKKWVISDWYKGNGIFTSFDQPLTEAWWDKLLYLMKKTDPIIEKSKSADYYGFGSLKGSEGEIYQANWLSNPLKQITAKEFQTILQVKITINTDDLKIEEIDFETWKTIDSQKTYYQ